MLKFIGNLVKQQSVFHRNPLKLSLKPSDIHNCIKCCMFVHDLFYVLYTFDSDGDSDKYSETQVENALPFGSNPDTICKSDGIS